MSQPSETGPDGPRETPLGGPPGAVAAGPPGGGPRGRRRLPAAQWPTVLGLTVVWVLLWGTPSVANVITGILVGVIVCVVFPLPPIETQVRLRPVGLVRFTVRFVIDMAVSSWRLNRYILGSRPPQCAVLAVRMRTPSDLLLTATSVAVAAIPGSNVLDVHRASGMLFVHVVGAGEEAERERARYEVLRLEDRVVRAFGTRADVAALDAWEGRGPSDGLGGGSLGSGGPGKGTGGTSDSEGRGGPWKRS